LDLKQVFGTFIGIFKRFKTKKLRFIGKSETFESTIGSNKAKLGLQKPDYFCKSNKKRIFAVLFKKEAWAKVST